MKTTVKITSGRFGRAKGNWDTAYSGEILEDGILVGTFSQKSTKEGYWPMTWKFRTSFAKDRFEALHPRLTISESIDAMISNKRPPSYDNLY